MPKVYVVQESPGKNLLPAADYGDVQVLLPANAQMMFNPQPTVRELRYQLRNFNKDDYILALGDPAAIGVACVVAAEKTAGTFKMLKWDRNEMRYYEVFVDVHDREGRGKPRVEAR